MQWERRNKSLLSKISQTANGLGWMTIGLGVCVFLVVGLEASPVEPKGLAERIEKLQQNYRMIDTFHIRASFVSVPPGVSPDVVTAMPERTHEYESFADGSKYVEKGRRSETHFAGPWNREVAFDGDHYQNFINDVGEGTLTFRRGDVAVNGATTENPLFMPISFLSTRSSVDPLHTLRLTDVHSDAKWATALSGAEVVEATELPIGHLRVRLPGRGGGAKEFHYELEFGAEPDYMPVTVAKIGAAGEVVQQFKFAEYTKLEEDGSLFYVPKRIVSVHPNEKLPEGVSDTLSILVEVAKLQEEISDDVFTISLARAKVVWDDDSNSFLKSNTNYSENISKSIGDSLEFSEGGLSKGESMNDNEVGAGSAVGFDSSSGNEPEDSWSYVIWLGLLGPAIIVAMMLWRRKRNGISS